MRKKARPRFGEGEEASTSTESNDLEIRGRIGPIVISNKAFDPVSGRALQPPPTVGASSNRVTPSLPRHYRVGPLTLLPRRRLPSYDMIEQSDTIIHAALQ